MKTVNIHEAKTHLSRLVEEAKLGEVIIIAKAGKPMAQLTPLTKQIKTRQFGLLKKKIHINDDFDASLPDDFLDEFEGLPKK